MTPVGETRVVCPTTLGRDASGRSVVDIGDGNFGEYLANATALVTGAGGSVGSELCVRLARRGAAELVLVDQAEASLVAAARSLRRPRNSRTE